MDLCFWIGLFCRQVWFVVSNYRAGGVCPLCVGGVCILVACCLCFLFGFVIVREVWLPCALGVIALGLYVFDLCAGLWWIVCVLCICFVLMFVFTFCFVVGFVMCVFCSRVLVVVVTGCGFVAWEYCVFCVF